MDGATVSMTNSTFVLVLLPALSLEAKVTVCAPSPSTVIEVVVRASPSAPSTANRFGGDARRWRR